MIFYLTQYIQEHFAGTTWESWFSPLRVFRYISFRSAGAAVTSLAICWWLGPRTIHWLRRLAAQTFKDKAEEAGGLTARVRDKRGTPSMGGVLIVLALDLSVLLWAKWTEFIALSLISLVVLAGLGFYDDYLKLAKRNNRGAHSRVKLLIQWLLAIGIGFYLWSLPSGRVLVSEIQLPFYKHSVLQGAIWAGILVTGLTIVGSSNAVNLTDGLDGLAAGCSVIVSAVFVILTYLAGHAEFADYLQIPYVPQAGELTVFCAALAGATLGFLWYNCHPAKVFMGDTGSLALGGAFGIVAVLIHQPFILVIAGGVFVAEAVSVMLQTSWFKYTRRTYGEGRRIFKMAPLHHHFERLGWHESEIVTRFYILCFLCAMMALSSLKIR